MGLGLESGLGRAGAANCNSREVLFCQTDLQSANIFPHTLWLVATTTQSGGGTRHWKLGVKNGAKNFAAAPPLSQFAPTYWGHITFLPLPPVETAIRSADELTERSDKKLFKPIHYPVSVPLSITCYLRFQCILCVQEATLSP